MQVKVLLFASLREIVGEDSLGLELPTGSRCADLRTQLSDRWPRLANLPFVFAVNREYAKEDRMLGDGDEVALVPAISGGGDERLRFSFHDGPLDPRALEAWARRDEDGAIVTFHGVTRNHHGGRGVERLVYESFEEMAADRVQNILADIAATHDVGRFAVQHRLGEVPIGESSIIVIVAAHHRAPAFAAVREIMDRIKKEVPIFKKEVLNGEGERWVGELPDVGSGE